VVGDSAPGKAHLELEPAQVELEVALGVPTTVAVAATFAGADVTGAVTWSLDGASLGSVDAGGLAIDGRTGGSARLIASLGTERVEVPVHVKLTSLRAIDAPAAAPAWFRDAIEVAGTGVMDPVDRAVIPPNLARLEVAFTASDLDDVQELAVTSADLDVRVQGAAAPGPRELSLSAAEWEAVVRTSRGRTIDVAARSASSSDPTTARAMHSSVAIADLDFASEILFTGRPVTELPQLWSYSVARGSTERFASALPGGCLGCHVTMSRDGTRIAAAGNDGTNGGGLILDMTTRSLQLVPSATGGSWTAAAYDPSGALVTTGRGVMELRDGSTASVVATIETGDAVDRPAQPAISRDGRALAYIAGKVDAVTTQPVQEELRIASWDAAAATLGASRVLATREAGVQYKLPDFSHDDRWVAFTRGRAPYAAADQAVVVQLADGSGAPVQLASGVDFPRFATPIVAAASGGDAEPMTWLVVKSDRPIGGRTNSHNGKLWVMAFYPDRQVASPPVPLPGQDPSVAVLHAPIVR
jgi:hypothetical protein